MRLTVILITLGLGVWGPMLIDAERVVFVVPRYIKRSSTGGAAPFYNHDDRSYKIRPPRRPSFFGGHSGPNPMKNAAFFHGEKHRVTHGGDGFNPEYFAPQRVVNHVIIPHGKGVSHGISFGKGYIPHDEFNGGNENYEFPHENENGVDFGGQDHQGDVKFEDEGFPRFQSGEQASGTQNTDWAYAPQESGYAAADYGQVGKAQEESRLEVQDAYQNQGRASVQREEFFFPKGMTGEESRAVLQESVSHGNPHHVNAAPVAAQAIMAERKPPAPIILQDTIDMREYVEKVAAFAKSWPPAAALQGFGWKNQILNPPGLTLPNYQGFNSWTGSLPRAQGTGSYQVQEDQMEEPSRRSFRTVTM